MLVKYIARDIMEETDDMVSLEERDSYTEVRHEAPWCRELVVRRICSFVKSRGVRDFSVYGIVDGKGVYRPDHLCHNHSIGTHAPIIGRLVSFLFHTTMGLASDIFLGTTFSWSSWERCWSSGLHLKIPVYPSEYTPLCTIDVDNPERVGHGSLTNLPGWVGESIPLISFLLYLPRVWYNLTILRYDQTQINHQKLGGTQEEAFLGYIGSHLAVPLYRMPHGGATFWSFLDFLMTAVSVPERKSKARCLLSNIRCSGYSSWMDELMMLSNPEWCQEVRDRNTLYREYGPFALVHPRTIDKTI